LLTGHLVPYLLGVDAPPFDESSLLTPLPPPLPLPPLESSRSFLASLVVMVAAAADDLAFFPPALDLARLEPWALGGLGPVGGKKCHG